LASAAVKGDGFRDGQRAEPAGIERVNFAAVRLQGLTSSPTPETQVLVAWALNMVVPDRTRTKTCNNFIFRISYFPFNLLQNIWDRLAAIGATV
jgi:hypothetical protein